MNIKLNQGEQYNFVNEKFEELYNRIVNALPLGMFAMIMIAYIGTGILNAYFLPAHLFIAIVGSAVIQAFRFFVVFIDFLNATGKRTRTPEIAATLFTLLAIVELAFSIAHLHDAFTPTWFSLVLFGTMVILSGYVLEIRFISKGAEAYNLDYNFSPTSSRLRSNSVHSLNVNGIQNERERSRKRSNERSNEQNERSLRAENERSRIGFHMNSEQSRAAKLYEQLGSQRKVAAEMGISVGKVNKLLKG